MRFGYAFNFLIKWFKEFVPALKTECLIVGYGSMLIAICLTIECVTGGITIFGPNRNMFLHPGTTGPFFLGGLFLAFCAHTMKPVPREEM